MQKFRVGDIWVLICTDLMARGIDFKTVNSVLNFDFPTSLVSYIHRVGRTGRAGRVGTATTYFTDADLPYVKTIANLMQKSDHEVPEWLSKLKDSNTANNKQWKQLSEKPIRRKTISTSVERNTNRRHIKLIKKDARRIQNKQSAASGEGGDADLDFDDDMGEQIEEDFASLEAEFPSDSETPSSTIVKKHKTKSKGKTLGKRTRKEAFGATAADQDDDYAYEKDE